MRRLPVFVLAFLALSACSAVPDRPVATAPASAPAGDQPAPLADLVEAVDIPYETFTLANGLTTIVHTDRKAPIVGVTLYYRVGSKHEPRGRTGFAHLYEHLFFGGSENVPDFDKPLEAAGASTNGSTWYDRTNYVETVPKGALDLALFLESDRMGHLLGAVTQDKLDKQRGVVQNEKRQGDNEPYGLIDYAIGDGLFPVGHPYRHSTIGSMADLDAASLADVRQWFHDHYGPNNVIVALAGDIDAATARPLVEKWFGAIPRGPEVAEVAAGPVTLAAPVKREMTDQVPLTRITRNWSGPGLNGADAPALQIGMHILGGLASSRLDNALVRGEQLAVRVTAGAQDFEQVSFLQATMDIKPGVDRARAEARFDQLIAQFVAQGPTEDEVRRAATAAVTGEIAALERVGGFYGKGAKLAEGLLYSGDPAKYRENLARIAALTPAEVTAALQRWLNRPAFSLAVTPGPRTEQGEAMGGWGDEATHPLPAADAPRPATAAPRSAPRVAPPIAAVDALAFPVLERAKLANGVPVTLARRTAVPKLLVSLSFDAGFAADALDAPGTQATMLDMLDEGVATPQATLDATQVAEQLERLGATIQAGGSMDTSTVTLSALTANLAPSLSLLRDVVRHPTFADADVARLRDQQLAELAQALSSPRTLAQRELGKRLFAGHPYAQPSDGLGDAASLKALTPAALRAAHGKWLRPDTLRITVVGDVAMAELIPLLERAFGDWRPPAGPAPAKDLSAAIPAPRSRIVLIDRPDSPQSVIVAGRVLPVGGRDKGLEPLELANEVLGDGFLSRLNMDLREDRGWSYGVRSGIRQPVGPRMLSVVAPVQADRTGDSIKALLAGMAAFPASRPVDAEELNRVTEGNIRALPGAFETNAQVLSAVTTNALLGRPDDYYATLPDRYRALDAAALDAAARRYLQPQGLTFLIVGDRKLVEPQLTGLGMPVEIAPPSASGD